MYGNFLKLQYNVSLKDKNTLGIDSSAEKFILFRDISDCNALCDYYKAMQENQTQEKFGALGEGSNILLLNKHTQSVIVKMNNKGMAITGEDDKYIYAECQAGELWRDFVVKCCESNYSGLENLAAIYGTAGAAPVQNIGAYGAEVKDTVEKVVFLNLRTGKTESYTNSQCCFSYRNSVFKYQDGTKIILSVVFKLRKNFVFNGAYKPLREAFSGTEYNDIVPMDVVKKVTQIRNSKLPDPKEYANAGSFFKNPYVSEEKYRELKAEYGDISAFDEGDMKKISAGWLIEKCGFKGKRTGNVGMHDRQALVLVNYGVESADEITEYAQNVIAAVEDRFGISLVMEPNTIE